MNLSSSAQDQSEVSDVEENDEFVSMIDYSYNFFPRKVDITQSLIDNCKDLGSGYFKCQQLTSYKTRLRLPRDTTSLNWIYPKYSDDFTQKKNSYEVISTSKTNKCFSSDLRRIAAQMREGRFYQVIENAKIYRKRYESSVIFTLYGYVASLCAKDDDAELEYLLALEEEKIDINELPQFYHFMDELLVFPTIKNLPILSSLLCGNKSLHASYVCNAHVLPKINLLHKKSKINAPDVDEILMGVKFISDSVSKNLPHLKSVIEGYEMTIQPEPDRAKLDKWFAKEKYLLVIGNASVHLLQHNGDLDLYFLRAFSLMKLGKVHDAIKDITAALVKSKDRLKASKARAGLWLLLGEYELTKQDILLFEPRDEIVHHVLEAIRGNDPDTFVMIENSKHPKSSDPFI